MEKEEVVKGGFYLTVVNVFSQVLSIVLNLILARLLEPEDFGLMALVITYLGFIGLFTKVGFGSAIIQKSNPTKVQISTLYWLSMLFGLLTFIIIVAGTPYVAQFYEAPRLNEIIWIAALSVVINPIYMIQYKLLEKNLKFGILSKANIIASISAAIGASLAALAGWGVFALVVQALVGNLTRLVIILSKSQWRPAIEFNLKEVRDLFAFSLKFKLSQSLLYVDRNIDYLILGKYFSSVVLGYYSFAYNVMYTPVKRISYIFNDVLFPTLSSLQDNPQKVVRGYFKSVELVAIISFPLMTLLALNTELVLNFLFGNKWDGAIPIIKILCFAGAIQSISQLGSVVFNSLGRPIVDFYFGLTRSSLTIIAIVVGAKYGVEVVAWFLLVTKLISYFIVLIVMYHMISFPIRFLWEYLGKAIFVCAVLFGVTFLGDYIGLNELAIFTLSTLIAGGVTLLLNFNLISSLFLVLKKKIR